MNPFLDQLHPYPFEKLATLKSGIDTKSKQHHIALSIGEPKHNPPEFVLNTLIENLSTVRQYPATKGLPELREAIGQWLIRRYQLSSKMINSEKHILPVNGSREALFAFAQAVVDPTNNPLVITPNPFYQIYEGAALLAGAEPLYVNCTAENQFIPDFSEVTEQQWQRCQLVYLCSPNNPTGSVTNLKQYQTLIELADRYDFIIASDECYSEIYFDEQQPPTGLLQACAAVGRDDFNRCIIFHSLSKRSNLPGLRSGFVAGDAEILRHFLQYRTYHGCAMSIPVQLASAAAWEDEEHVITNRSLYRQKFDCFFEQLAPYWSLTQPDAGFCVWAKTPIDDELFAKQLYAEQNMTVLPGSYLSRSTNGINPGHGYVRMALVASYDECEEAASRLTNFIQQL